MGKPLGVSFERSVANANGPKITPNHSCHIRALSQVAFRLCYIRGPEGVLLELAEELG